MAGVGPSTPSQTAWAILALLAAGEVDHPATSSGTQYLVRSQQEEGSWDESYYTGTGFPGYGIGKKPDRLPGEGERGHQGLDMPAGFMINYHLYRNYWPLLALGRFARATGNNKQPNTPEDELEDKLEKEPRQLEGAASS
jgi:squalene-hopene/tetraprenyl-beta-curcumene cyclase